MGGVAGMWDVRGWGWRRGSGSYNSLTGDGTRAGRLASGLAEWQAGRARRRGTGAHCR